MTYNSNDLKKEDIPIGYLELCLGPMFAGKTTHLLDLIDNFNHTTTPFTVIKPKIDNRYNECKITSHDKVSYNCNAIDTLDDTLNMQLTDNIIIEEGQFFENLYKYVVTWINEGKYIYIACLNGDFKMKPMGDISLLIPLANKIIHKTARCNCGRQACFTSRIVNNENQILIGGIGIYRPVCRKCHNINNI